MGKTMHGGRRPGSGRPLLGTSRRVTISFSVDQATAQAVKELRGNGCRVGSVIESAILAQHDKIFNI